VRFTKLVLNLRVTTYDLRQVTSPIMEVKRYYIVSYIFYIINPTAAVSRMSYLSMFYLHVIFLELDTVIFSKVS